MSDDLAGEQAPGPASGDHLEEMPAVGIAKRELRTGKILLGVAAPALGVGVVAEVIAVSAPHFVWHGVAIAGLVFAGMLIIQGTSKIRDARATIRDEIRRQQSEGTS